MDQFCSDLDGSDLVNSSLDNDLSVLIQSFNSTLQSLLGRHAPIKERTFTLRPPAPWLTDELKRAKRKRRRLERKWRSTRSDSS